MTKILHVITDLTMGGAEKSLLRLVEAHHAQGTFRHQIISLRGRGVIAAKLEAAGAQVEALGLDGVMDLPKVMLRLVRLVRDLKPAVVHCWMYHANLFGGLAARLSRARILWGIRASYLNSSMGVAGTTVWMRRACARLSRVVPDRIVYVAQSARAAHEALGYCRGKGLVIPNGFGRPPAVSRAEARQALGIPVGKSVIGSVGRFNAAKDPDNFIRAAALVAKAKPDAFFMMAGLGLSPDNAALTGWIAQSNLTDRFALIGPQEDVNLAMSAMDVFCLHSVTEAFPNVLAEAMSAGVPCVTTDVGDAAQVLGDGGLVVPPSDPEALATALLKMLAKGPEERQAIGQQGAEVIANDYSLAAVADRYAALYSELTRR